MKKKVRKGHLVRSGKRWLALFVCVCMIITMIPVTAKAETETQPKAGWNDDKTVYYIVGTEGYPSHQLSSLKTLPAGTTLDLTYADDFNNSMYRFTALFRAEGDLTIKGDGEAISFNGKSLVSTPASEGSYTLTLDNLNWQEEGTKTAYNFLAYNGTNELTIKYKGNCTLPNFEQYSSNAVIKFQPADAVSTLSMTNFEISANYYDKNNGQGKLVFDGGEVKLQQSIRADNIEIINGCKMTVDGDKASGIRLMVADTRSFTDEDKAKLPDVSAFRSLYKSSGTLKIKDSTVKVTVGAKENVSGYTKVVALGGEADPNYYAAWYTCMRYGFITSKIEIDNSNVTVDVRNKNNFGGIGMVKDIEIKNHSVVNVNAQNSYTNGGAIGLNSTNISINDSTVTAYAKEGAAIGVTHNGFGPNDITKYFNGNVPKMAIGIHNSTITAGSQNGGAIGSRLLQNGYGSNTEYQIPADVTIEGNSKVVARSVNGAGIGGGKLAPTVQDPDAVIINPGAGGWSSANESEVGTYSLKRSVVSEVSDSGLPTSLEGYVYCEGQTLTVKNTTDGTPTIYAESCVCAISSDTTTDTTIIQNTVNTAPGQNTPIMIGDVLLADLHKDYKSVARTADAGTITDGTDITFGKIGAGTYAMTYGSDKDSNPLINWNAIEPLYGSTFSIVENTLNRFWTQTSQKLGGSITVAVNGTEGEGVTDVYTDKTLYVNISGLTPNAAISSGMLTYQWYKDSAPISDAVDNSYTPTEAGEYCCVVTGTKLYHGSVTSSTVNAAKKKEYTADEVNKNYLAAKVNEDMIRLTDYIPSDCKNAVYEMLGKVGAVEYNTEPSVDSAGNLTYTVASGDAENEGTITIKVSSDNYLDFEIIVKVKLMEKIPVKLQTGSSVTLENNTLIYGEALSKLQLNNAVFVNENGDTVEGTLAWKTPEEKPNAGTTKATWVFSPISEDYAKEEGMLEIVVSKATPYIETAPTAAAITYGDTLGLSTLTGGTAKYSDSDSTSVAGDFAWANCNIQPSASDSNTTTYQVVFTPSDAVNYNTAAIAVTLTVNKAENAPNMPSVTMNVANSCAKVSDVTLPSGWVCQDTDKDKELTVDTPVTATAVYNGADKGNYENETVSVTITRSACDHVAGEILYTGDGEHAPTCTVDGLGHRECTICHETIKSGIIVKGEHSFETTWTIDKPATTTSEGSKSHHCTKCDAITDVTVIPKETTSEGGSTSGSGSSSGGSSSGGSSSGGGNISGGSNSEVNTGKDSGSNVTTTTSPTEVKVENGTASATVKAENVTEAIKQAADNKSAEIVFTVSEKETENADNIQLTITKSDAQQILDKTDADLVVATTAGDVVLPQETLKEAISEAGGNTITIEIDKVTTPTEAQKEAAGENGYIVEIMIASQDKAITTFGGNILKIRLEVPTALVGKDVAVIHIAEDGKTEKMPGKIVTVGTKQYYEFTTTHLSTFALIEETETKEDTPTITAPKKGTLLTDSKTKMVYKVTKSGTTGGTVQFVKTKNTKAKTITIPAIVTIDGITYKVTSIVANALKNNKTVTTVAIGRYVTSIGSNAFSGCSKLKKVTIGKSVTTIGSKAFYKCTSLISITIPSKVKKIGNYVFKGCTKLKTIKLSTSLLATKTVSEYAFVGVSASAVVKVPKSKAKNYKKLLIKKGLGKKVTIKNL